MFHSFLSDENKQEAATTAAHSKHIIELLKEYKLLLADLSTIWDNIDCCAGWYMFATELYLLSVLDHTINILADCGVGAPGNDIDVDDGLKTTSIVSISVNGQIVIGWINGVKKIRSKFAPQPIKNMSV